VNWHPIVWPEADPTSPYYQHGPSLISFSGGRTSGYMLFMVLRAHGGILPDYVRVVFANTGKEAPETLRFVYECGVRWNVKIWWVEWRARTGPIEDRFEIVSFDSASRNGEPLAALFKARTYLPNAVTRFCTADGKIQAMKWFMLAEGFTKWTNVVGLRADERPRLIKIVLNNLAKRERWVSACPLALAGVMRRHVLRFWLGRNADGRDRRYPLPQGFDLGLLDHEGNCDACFLKGFMVLAHQERAKPGTLDWWIAQEDAVNAMIAAGETADRPSGARFITEHTYRQIRDYAHSSAELPGLDDLDTTAECGVACAVGGPEEEVDDAAFAWLINQLRIAMETPLEMPVPRIAQPAAVGDLFGDDE
jgi:hypothetical protein